MSAHASEGLVICDLEVGFSTSRKMKHGILVWAIIHRSMPPPLFEGISLQWLNCFVTVWVTAILAVHGWRPNRQVCLQCPALNEDNSG
jgi:hypothetical protein